MAESNESQPTQGIDYAAVLADLEQRRADLDRAITAVKVILGQASTPPGGSNIDFGGLGAPTEIQMSSDAFFGMNISAAAQKYLSIRKKPATGIEIAEALDQGGYTHQSANLANTVNSVLMRNTSIFAKVKRGTWGLRIWYPNFRAKDNEG